MTTNTTIAPELLDQLLANYEKPEDLTGDGGLFKQLKKALIERALGAELTDHLGYEKGDPAGRGKGNSRNGTSSKTVLTGDGEVERPELRPRRGLDQRLLQLIGKTAAPPNVTSSLPSATTPRNSAKGIVAKLLMKPLIFK